MARTPATLPFDATVRDAAHALLAGVAAVAGSYAAAGSTPRFVVAPVHGAVVALTPDVVVRYSILLLGKAGEGLAVGLALAVAVALFAAAAAVGRRLGAEDFLEAPLAGLGAAGACWLVAAALTRDLVGAVGPGLAAGVAVALLVATEPGTAADEDGAADGEAADGSSTAVADRAAAALAGRRRLLAAAGGLAGFSVLSYAVGERTTDSGASAPLSSVLDDERGDRVAAEVEARLAAATERSLDVDAIPGLVSDRFYEVDIDAVNPAVGADDWSLSVTGAVAEEVTVDYDDLLAEPPEHRFSTLRCVGEDLNGRLMDTALWTGVPAARVLDRVDPRGEFVVLRAADGYFEEFPLSALEESLLAYGMNGRTLPRRHGYPVRALVPGHWGEINVKWLTEVEVTRDPVEGYWEQRGWHGTGPVNTVAKLWAVEHRGGTVRVAGHAYAGTRGVDRVEVSTDGGATWSAATLSEPLPDRDVWRQWVHEYEPESGSHEVVVRAVDGEGRVQVRDEHGSYPSGATGWVSRTVDV